MTSTAPLRRLPRREGPRCTLRTAGPKTSAIGSNAAATSPSSYARVSGNPMNTAATGLLAGVPRSRRANGDRRRPVRAAGLAGQASVGNAGLGGPHRLSVRGGARIPAGHPRAAPRTPCRMPRAGRRRTRFPSPSGKVGPARAPPKLRAINPAAAAPEPTAPSGSARSALCRGAGPCRARPSVGAGRCRGDNPAGGRFVGACLTRPRRGAAGRIGPQVRLGRAARYASR